MTLFNYLSIPRTNVDEDEWFFKWSTNTVFFFTAINFKYNRSSAAKTAWRDLNIYEYMYCVVYFAHSYIVIAISIIVSSGSGDCEKVMTH